MKTHGIAKFTQCSPKVSPSGIIFFSILAMNIGDYRSLRLPGVYAYLFITKNFETDAAWTDEKSGLDVQTAIVPLEKLSVNSSLSAYQEWIKAAIGQSSQTILCKNHTVRNAGRTVRAYLQNQKRVSHYRYTAYRQAS